MIKTISNKSMNYNKTIYAGILLGIHFAFHPFLLLWVDWLF